MKKSIKVTLAVLSVALLAVLSAAVYNAKFDLPFEPVERIAVKDIPDSEPAWFSLRDEKYSGFFDIEELTEYGARLAISVSSSPRSPTVIAAYG